MKAESFQKSERICSKQLIEQLFGGGNATMAAFPLRAVYKFIPAETPASSSADSIPAETLDLDAESLGITLQAAETSSSVPSSSGASLVGGIPDWPDRIPVQVLVSVSKRKFHHAVDRNRMKRQIREAYRRRKQPLWTVLKNRNAHLALAFICLSNQACTTRQVCRSMDRILRRICEEVSGDRLSHRRG